MFDTSFSTTTSIWPGVYFWQTIDLKLYAFTFWTLCGFNYYWHYYHLWAFWTHFWAIQNYICLTQMFEFWYLLKPWRKLQIVLRFDCSLLLHPHMRILFYFNESGKTGFTLMILIKQSMILFTFILEFSILVAVWEFPHQIGSKHLKLPVTDDFAGVVKIPKLVKRDLPAKGDQIWYFHFCGVILLFSR